MVLFTLSNISLGRLFQNIYNKDKIYSLADIIIHSNSTALFCTIMVIAVYESIYFMNQLRNSVEETEKLKRKAWALNSMHWRRRWTRIFF